jgi:hypothetical protein
MHPQEAKLFTDGELNHSMGNVFAVKTHKEKPKEECSATKRQDGNMVLGTQPNSNDSRKMSGEAGRRIATASSNK